MNILITSVGRRRYMIDFLRDALNGAGEVHVSNSQYTYVFEYADKSVITPLCFDEEYIPFLKEYCEKNTSRYSSYVYHYCFSSYPVRF